MLIRQRHCDQSCSTTNRMFRSRQPARQSRTLGKIKSGEQLSEFSDAISARIPNTTPNIRLFGKYWTIPAHRGVQTEVHCKETATPIHHQGIQQEQGYYRHPHLDHRRATRAELPYVTVRVFHVHPSISYGAAKGDFQQSIMPPVTEYMCDAITGEKQIREQFQQASASLPS